MRDLGGYLRLGLSNTDNWLLKHLELFRSEWKFSAVIGIVYMPMFMNSGADLALEFKPRRAIFATKNVCKNLIANVQLEAMGQEQVVPKW